MANNIAAHKHRTRGHFARQQQTDNPRRPVRIREQAQPRAGTGHHAQCRRDCLRGRRCLLCDHGCARLGASRLQGTQLVDLGLRRCRKGILLLRG